jgi:hypothetical protein
MRYPLEIARSRPHFADNGSFNGFSLRKVLIFHGKDKASWAKS